MSIEKRGKDTWRIRVGKNDSITENFRGARTEARRREREMRVDAQRGATTTASREDVETYLDRWISHGETIGKIRPRTAEVYRGYVRRTILPIIGELKVTDLRPVHVQSVIDQALANELSARSVRQVFAIMRAAFRQAVKWQLIAVNPCDGATPPKVEAAKLTTPTPVDIAALVEAIDPAFRAPLLVAAGTGARRGEICGLRWADVDLDGDRGQIRIEGTLQRGSDGKLVRLAPKSARSRRTLPLSATLTAALRAVRKEQNERRMQWGPAWRDTDYVFDTGNGSPVDPDTFTRAFREARKATGLQGVRLHDLRHAVASLLVANGTDIRTVADLLGHATVGFTLQVYVHPSRAAAETAIDDVERMLGGQ